MMMTLAMTLRMIMMGLPINNPVSGVFDGCDYDRNIAVNHAVQLVVLEPTPEF